MNLQGFLNIRTLLYFLRLIYYAIFKNIISRERLRERAVECYTFIGIFEAGEMI